MGEWLRCEAPTGPIFHSGHSIDKKEAHGWLSVFLPLAELGSLCMRRTRARITVSYMD